MTTKSHLIFIEWRDSAGLHADTAKTILDIKFLKDELRFLKDLMAAHTLELIYGNTVEESKVVINQLTAHSNRLITLLKALEVHCNNLQVVMDDDDVPGEMQSYKDEHYRLMIEEMDLHADLKKTKQIIFKMLAEVMKKSKQKKLI